MANDEDRMAGAPADGSAQPAGTPRWVKVFGIIGVLLLMLVVVLLLVGGHGPQRHTGSGGTDLDSVTPVGQPR